MTGKAAPADGSPPGNGRGWVLWSGTIGLDSPVPARLEASLAGGYDRMTIGPPDVARAAAGGVSWEELGRSARDVGLGIVMDPMMGWYNDEPPPGPYAPFRLDEMLRMCEALQVSSISVLGPFREDEATPEELIRRFAGLCDRAADIGAQVQLEFMPMTTITDVASAWAIVESADRDNGGIVFDTWHFFRGNPDFADLERVPGDRIFAVQVADAPARLNGTLAEDTFNRMLPGDGELDLTGVVRALDRMGALRWVGPEVISPFTASMPPVEAARLAGDRVRQLLATATSGD
jgi:sugar phosphate isomerase/epimerase